MVLDVHPRAGAFPFAAQFEFLDSLSRGILH
jgi:hypothetical protein